MLDAAGKVDLLRSYASRFDAQVSVETGIYQGGASTPALGLDHCFLLDVDPANCARAQERYPNATVVCGDSRWTMLAVVNELPLRGPVLFWLDAHWLPDDVYAQAVPCPLLCEAEAIALKIPRFQAVVLVDDVRLLDGTNGYPTLEQVKEVLWPWQFEVEDDVARFTP